MELNIKIPSQANEIPLHLYQSFVNDAANIDTSINKSGVTEKMIEYFCAVEPDKVKLISLKSVLELNTHFDNMFNKKMPLQRRFFLNNVEFGMIPDLENISFEEYVDIEKYISNWDTMNKAMAVLYRPIVEKKGDKYLIEKYQGSANYSDVMLYAPTSIALSSTVFFWNLGQELLQATVNYLKVETKKMSKTFLVKDNLQENGDGISQSILSLEDALRNLTPLQPYPLINV